MHIVYIHQFFCVPSGASGTRSYDISRHLVNMGHKVTMICGVSHMCGIAPLPWYKPYRKERMDGFDVIVCNAGFSNYQNALSRMFTFVWFAFLATMAVCFTRKVEVIFATSLPLTVGIPGYIGSKIHRTPFVFEVRDIFPEGDVISGNIKKGSLLERLLLLLEKFLYIKSQFILMVSPGFKTRLIERGFPGEKMEAILLGADGDLFKDVVPDSNFRARYNIENKTIAVYTGAHGSANGLDYILDAADLIKNRDGIVLVLIGDGREKLRLVERAKQMDLNNVLFLDPVPKTELMGILAVCDIGLMILYDVGPRPVTPNKIFDYMFSSMPTIVNFEGPTIEMVNRDQTGVFASPKKPEELADRVTYWADHPEQAKGIGNRAREIAYEKYDRVIIARQLAEVFGKVVDGYSERKDSRKTTEK